MMIITAQDPVLVGLGAFTFLAGILVLVFLMSQTWGVLVRGKTGNEAEKWEDLAEAIKREEVVEWPRELKEYNQNYGKTEKGKDVIAGEEMVKLGSVKEIRNIYDRGFVRNVTQVMFPKKF
jgi:hypothetical protein